MNLKAEALFAPLSFSFFRKVFITMLFELLKKNRSIRSFDPAVRITKEELENMVECTRFCPSSANLQALKFKLVYTTEECEKVFANTKWAGYLKNEKIPPEGCEPTAYVIVLHDKNIAPNPVPFYKDTGIVSHTILLRACEMGFGGCMIGSFDENKIKEALSIPEELEITLVLAMGKPNETPEITDASGDIKYYRENGRHYVPKRSIEEIII